MLLSYIENRILVIFLKKRRTSSSLVKIKEIVFFQNFYLSVIQEIYQFNYNSKVYSVFLAIKQTDRQQNSKYLKKEKRYCRV